MRREEGGEESRAEDRRVWATGELGDGSSRLEVGYKERNIGGREMGRRWSGVEVRSRLCGRGAGVREQTEKEARGVWRMADERKGNRRGS